MTSLRGGNKFYKNLFVEEQQKHTKGRSRILIEKRNECLIDRYCFYGIYSGVRYEIVIDKMSEEFHLAAHTIANILDKNFQLMSQTKKQLKGITVDQAKRQFKKKWPYLVWEKFEQSNVEC